MRRVGGCVLLDALVVELPSLDEIGPYLRDSRPGDIADLAGNGSSLLVRTRNDLRVIGFVIVSEAEFVQGGQ